MKDFKISAFMVIGYLTVCGTLYHVAFWGEFNLNGLVLINASDIIKYAILPILPAFLVAAITLTVSQVSLTTKKLFPPPIEGEPPRIEKFKNHKTITNILLIAWGVLSLSAFLIDKNPYRWTSWAYLTGIPMTIILNRNAFLETQLPDYKPRIIVVNLIVLLPLLSFAKGKENSGLISKNIEFQYLAPGNGNTDTLKYIGMTQEKVVFTDMQNSRIVILNASRDTLVLYTNIGTESEVK